LTIVPDGFLSNLPFDALLTQAPNAQTSLRNAPYLLRSQQLRYAWSWAVLNQQNSLQSAAPRSLLAIAPGFAQAERGLSPLATDAAEWQPLSDQKNTTLRGQSADYSHFATEAGQHRVLHLATHAIADAPTRIELIDRSVYLSDIFALPLQADLVVLSACQTGLGREQRGEGVMSLARAFAQAGAACVMSSLWAVNDQSTTRLLRQFYQYLAEGNTTSTALHAAKMAYLSDQKVPIVQQSPYFWAGFLAIGADRVLPPATPYFLPWMVAAALIVLAILFLFWRKKRR
jgi:CHAT domain-containing protein